VSTRRSIGTALGEIWGNGATFRVHQSRHVSAFTSGRRVAIKDARGRAVYRQTRSLRAGGYTWQWNGKIAAGRAVKAGGYRATVSATAGGRTLTKSTTVRVATKVINQRKTLRKNYLSSRDSTKGNCYTSFSEYDETTTLDCWGGSFAATTFTFKIPANARGLRWSAATGRNQLDKCCQGSITKTGHRVGKTRYQIRIQVTGWRAVDVYGARLSYKARVRI
jgi:hypothetical protein